MINEPSYRQVVEAAGTFYRLTLELEQPVELHDFAAAFASIGDQWQHFIAEEHPDLTPTARFYVREVRKGSIQADIVAMGLGFIDGPLDRVGIVAAFGGVIAATFRNLYTLGSGDASPDETETDTPPAAVLDRPNVRAMADLAKVVAQDPNGQGSLKRIEVTEDGERTHAVLDFDTAEARAVREGAKRFLLAPPEREEDEIAERPRRVLMRLWQHNQDPNVAMKRQTGHQAIVSDIADRPKPLRYQSELAAERMASILDGEPYQHLIFDVTIVPRVLEGKVKAYYLVEVHEWFEDDEPPPS